MMIRRSCRGLAGKTFEFLELCEMGLGVRWMERRKGRMNAEWYENMQVLVSADIRSMASALDSKFIHAHAHKQ